jgi:ABC-type multidrug transport system fused ATPase/permease subunit
MGPLQGMQKNVVWKSFQVLPKNDRKKLPLVFLAQILLSLLDLLGVAIIGLIAAISVNGIKSSAPGDKLNDVLNLLKLSDLKLQQQVSILGVLAAIVLITKSVASALLAQKIIYYFSRRGALISAELIQKLMSADLETIKTKSPQENHFALTTGVITISVGVIATAIGVSADLLLLAVLFSGLVLVDYQMASITVLIFGLAALFLYKYMHIRARKYGLSHTNASIASSQAILEAIYSFKEIFVRNQQGFYIKKISEQRMEIANYAAGLAFMPNLSKYAVEITLVAAAVFMSAIQFLTKDAVQAVGVLSIFLAASSRIAPAVLRIQQGFVQIRGHAGTVEQTFELIEKFKDVEIMKLEPTSLDFEHSGFVPAVALKHVNFRYKNSSTEILKNIDLQIFEGETIAIVGPSGAGKSTLVDIILGILEPLSGSVRVGGLTPKAAIQTWPGAISYLPQDVFLTAGSIKSNLTFGFDLGDVEEHFLNEAIKISQVEGLLRSLPDGINSTVNDRGDNFSGGQRQRLGIARALYTNPRLIFFDEATSSLDSETENAFTDALQELKGKVTIVMIAHRLSSILQADRIYYLEDGKILAQGTFSELKTMNANFAKQAEIMGL